MPFPPDAPKPPVVIPPRNPVQEAARAFRQRLATEYKAELDDLKSYAESQWREYRADHPFVDADTHEEFVNEIMKTLAPQRPPQHSDHQAYRLSLPYESRLTSLGEHGVLDEFMLVAVYRAGGKMHVAALREALAPYATMTDDEFHELLDQAGLTTHGSNVLFVTGSIEKERRPDYPTLPIHAEREYRPMLAPEDERYAGSDF